MFVISSARYLRHALLAATVGSAAPLAAQSAAAIGTTLDAIAVQDSAGPVTFRPADAPVTVVLFVSAQCPISNAYNERMNTVYADYASKGVRFVFANANVTETQEDMR